VGHLILHRLRPATTYIAYAGLVALSLWVSLYLSWLTLSGANFLYPVLYDRLDIGKTIQQYGPVNRFKKGLEMTTREERIFLFRQIVVAVNDDGRGLEAIRYHDAQGRPIGLLLRQPEIIHLRDVANLLQTLRLVAYGALVSLVVTVAGLWVTGIRFPSVRVIMGSVAGLVGLVTVFVVAYGPVAFFYKLHTMVFPAGHQWFFYYYESLMTTLMKAPDIFGYIAVFLLVLAVGYLALLLVGIRHLLDRRARRT
jgi:hypothetical protein